MLCRISVLSASVVVGVVSLLAAPGVSAQQLHKDPVRGFQFKPPKDYKSVALQPDETTLVAKYQDDTTSYGGQDGRTGYNQMFLVAFYPTSKDGTSVTSPNDSDSDEEDANLSPLDRVLKRLAAGNGNATVDKTKPVKVAGGDGKEAFMTSTMQPLSYYDLIVQQDDGIFVFEGSSFTQRFDKAASEFATAAKSFKRIPKADTANHDADLSQMSEQDRFLQQQIDKLPPGWSSMRTKRYLFLYNAEKSFVKELADRIEGMRDEYEKVYPPDHPITAVSIVRVCNSMEEYFGYGGPQGSGGYWNWKARELVIFDMAPREGTLAVINHEAFHQFIYYYYGQLSPHSWYNEGHGDYFAGAKMTKTNHISGFGDAPGGLGRRQDIKEGARLLAEGKKGKDGAAAPLKDVMHFHQSDYYGSKGYDIGVCYAEGWSIVLMLRQDKSLQPKWQKILPDYLKNLLEAREEVAKEVMTKALADAEKKKTGSSADLSRDVKDYYEKVDEDKVQDRTYEKTFKDWTDDDWAKFQAYWLKFVEKI